MQVSLCDKYGFDKTARQQRLALFGLKPSDNVLAGVLHETVIISDKKLIVGQFYDFLLGQPETAVFLTNPKQVEQLKRTQTYYLETLGVDFEEEAYFEYRLGVGLVHERIGLPLMLYQAAYRVLQEILIRFIPASLGSDDKQNLSEFILKITSLDISLATEIYHNTMVNRLTSSIIELKQEEQRLSSMTRIDSLTEAASREYLLDVLEHELALVGKRTITSCIAIIDLDYFKKVNDSYGHLVGDEILKGVVGRIKSRMRNLDIIGRYGGEEFVLIFPATELDRAVNIIERIRKHVESTPFHVDEFSIPVTISAGVTAAQINDTMDDILKRADQLLYQAKNNGRNRVES